MKNITGLTNKLLELKDQIEKFESYSNIEISSLNELEIFLWFSKLSTLNTKKVILKSLSKSSSENHRNLLITIKRLLKISIEFLRRNPNLLSTSKIENLVSNSIKPSFRNMKVYERKLQDQSKEINVLESSIEGLSWREEYLAAEELQNQKMELAEDYLDSKVKYHEIYDYYYQKLIVVTQYKTIKSNEILIKLEDILNFIEENPIKSKYNLEKLYVDIGTIKNIHEAAENDLFLETNIDQLFYLFNLIDLISNYEIPKGNNQKMYYLIHLLNEKISKKFVSNWKENILNRLDVKPELYEKNKVKANNRKASDSLKNFKERIDPIFN